MISPVSEVIGEMEDKSLVSRWAIGQLGAFH